MEDRYTTVGTYILNVNLNTYNSFPMYNYSSAVASEITKTGREILANFEKYEKRKRVITKLLAENE